MPGASPVDAAAQAPSSARPDERAPSPDRIDHGARAPGRAGIVTRLRADLVAWWRRRRVRRTRQRSERGIDGSVGARDLRGSERRLAMLTERIVRTARTGMSPAELAAAIAIAERIAVEYRGYVARLAAVRDGTTGATDLRARATAELARCASGLRRIDDAVAQLRALARRAALPPGPDPPAR